MYVFALHLKALIEDDRHKVTALEDKMFKVRVLGGKGAKGATKGNNFKKKQQNLWGWFDWDILAFPSESN